MEHIVRFEGGYDCIKFECVYGSDKCKPGTGGSHGRYGMNIRFVVKGEHGAVQFLLYTGWTPQYAKPSSIGMLACDWGASTIPTDLGYYSKTARYDGQKPIDEACEFCDGQPCYYDGSSLNANDAMYALVNGGGDALWTFLEGYYAATFNNEDYPQPAEFKMPLREANDQAQIRSEAESKLERLVGRSITKEDRQDETNHLEEHCRQLPPR